MRRSGRKGNPRCACSRNVPPSAVRSRAPRAVRAGAPHAWRADPHSCASINNVVRTCGSLTEAAWARRCVARSRHFHDCWRSRFTRIGYAPCAAMPSVNCGDERSNGRNLAASAIPASRPAHPFWRQKWKCHRRRQPWAASFAKSETAPADGRRALFQGVPLRGTLPGWPPMVARR